MKLISICAALLLVSGATLPGAEVPGYEEGVGAYNSGDFNRAYDIFSGLFFKNPENINVNYGLGLAAVRAGKHSHALFAFDRVLNLKPDDIRARLEVGRIYMELGQLALARKEFETAARANPPPNVQQNIDACLGAISKAQRRWAFSGRADLRMIYDDNINFGPASSTIDTLLGELTVMSESRPMDAWGGSGSLSGSGVYDPGDRGGWLITADVGVSQDMYADASAQEIRFLQAGAGIRRVSEKLLLDLPARFSALNYGHDDLLDMAGVYPTAAYFATPNIHFIARLNLEDRDYQDNDDRDAFFWQATGTLRWLLHEERASLSLNAASFGENADGDAFANDGWIAGASAELNVTDRLTAYTSVQFRQSEYNGILYPDLQDQPREDDQLQFIAGLRKNINRKWSLDLNHRYISNSSNFKLYDYDKNVTTLTSSFNF